jgi:hypothetical protein
MTNRKINYLKAAGFLVMSVYGLICSLDVTEPRIWVFYHSIEREEAEQS